MRTKFGRVIMTTSIFVPQPCRQGACRRLPDG